MARTGSAIRWLAMMLLLIVAGKLQARDDETDGLVIPKPGQPTNDFYGAAGTGVKILATATPTELTRDDWLTLTLTISNLENAADVVKPSLKKLEAFSSFQIEELDQLDPKPDPSTRNQRVFVYRLRAISEEVTLIPEIAFHYFDPKRVVSPNRPQDRFPKTYSKAITIRVLPPAKPPVVAPVPLDIPTFAARLAPREEVLAEPPGNPPVVVWLIALIVPPLLAIGWLVAWRRLYPDAAKLVLFKRNRAVRHALSAFAAAGRLPADGQANAVSAAFLNYLRERFELPPGAITVREITDHLRSTGCPAERIAQVETFLHNCDEQRFALVHDTRPSMVVEAEQLVIALEEPA